MRTPPGYYLPEDADVVAPKPKPRAKPTAPEHAIQVAIIKYLKLQVPGAVIHASPGGAVLAGDSERRAIAMGKLKAAGFLVGFPDVLCLWRDAAGHAHFWTFEVKGPGGRLSEDQVWVGNRIQANGGRWAVVRSVDDVQDAIREWRGDLP